MHTNFKPLKKKTGNGIFLEGGGILNLKHGWKKWDYLTTFKKLL